jgi:hypothetical protein
VDNSPIAYTFDCDNGLPIKTWVEDPNDKELMKLVPILEFLSKTKDVRKYIDKIVYNNKILFEDAKELMKMKEYIDKSTNSINMKNILNYNFLDEDSTIKDSKNNKNEETNNKETEKIKSKTKISNNDIDSDAFTDKGFQTTKNSNKLINNINFIANNINIKENITNINNINYEPNLNNNEKPYTKQYNKQNKKNVFRFKAGELKQPSKIGINNIILSDQFDPSLPLTLLLSNITKSLYTPKSQEKEIKDRNKKIKRKNLNNIKPVLLKDINEEKTTTNKKLKYINLLEKLKTNNKVTKSLNNINNNKKNNHRTKKVKPTSSMKLFNNKPYNLRVSSSISNYHGSVPGNKMTMEKSGTSYRVTKSKSTENFLMYSKVKHPKTPKEQCKQKIVIQNKKIRNFLDKFDLDKDKDIKIKNFFMKDKKGNINNKK